MNLDGNRFITPLICILFGVHLLSSEEPEENQNIFHSHSDVTEMDTI